MEEKYIKFEYSKETVKSDCPVLQNNLKKFFEEVAKHQDIVFNTTKSWDTNIRRGLANRYDLKIGSLQIYSGRSKTLQESDSSTEIQSFEVSDMLEQLAVSYLGLTHYKSLRPHVKELHTKFVELDNAIGATIDPLEDQLNAIEGHLNIFLSEPQEKDEYMKAFKALVTAREKLKSLPESISSSPLAQATEFNKQARSTDFALYIWVKAIYAIWINKLGRTISNSNDGINGRKHLLEYLVNLMEPLHQAIEYETLDNMLRKIQNEVKRDGELSMPDFKFGRSSPS